MLQLEDLAAWLVCTSCVLTLIPVMRRPPPRPRGWLLVLSSLLFLSVLHIVADQPFLARSAFALWSLLVIVPSLATTRLRYALLRRDLVRAQRWAYLLALTHPADGMLAQAQFVRFLLAMERSDPQSAEEQLQRLARSPAWHRRAMLQWLRETTGWERVMSAFSDGTYCADEPLLSTMYVQALGETGQLNAMWEAFGRLAPEVRARADVRMMVVGLGGSFGLMQRLLKLPTAVASDVCRFWHASAMQTCGLSSEAELPLQKLAAAGGAPARWAQARLRKPLPDQRAYEFTQQARSRIDALRRQVDEEQALSIPRERRGMAWGTISLGAVLLGVFASSVPGGSSNILNLIELGALVLPPTLVDGHLGYRIVAAGLLHFGGTHLFVNLLGLWVLGHQVERLWNSTTLWLFFFASSIGAMAIAVVTMAATPTEPKIIVGASAGVMGLVGALFTFAAVGYFVAGNTLLRRSLTRIVAIVGLQTLFDWMTPAVSSQLHLTGLLLGALVALPFAHHRFRKQARIAERVSSKTEEPHLPLDEA